MNKKFKIIPFVSLICLSSVAFADQNCLVSLYKNSFVADNHPVLNTRRLVACGACEGAGGMTLGDVNGTSFVFYQENADSFLDFTYHINGWAHQEAAELSFYRKKKGNPTPERLGDIKVVGKDAKIYALGDEYRVFVGCTTQDVWKEVEKAEIPETRK